MNFQLAGTGQSFKGAFAYYLHDKRTDPTGPHPTTAERVSWMEVLNLAHDDPAYVQGVMIATARNAGQLKQEAGGSKGGRKATGGAVFSYSLQWHPENETIPDKAGMLEIARETLKILGAEDRQVAIIAHTDTAHPHLHIVVNRVDPTTGKMLVLHKNADKLDDFAARYERERGQIVSPNRDRKHRERGRKAQEAGEAPPPQIAAEPVTAAPTPAPAPEKVAPAKQTAAPALPAPPARPAAPPRPKSPAAELFDQQEAQKVRHKQEWRDLAAANRESKSAVFGERIDFKAIAADHKASTRPEWSELGKSLAAERKAFRSRDREFPGLVANALALATIQIGRGETQGRGVLSQTFRLMLDRHARHAGFTAWEQGEKAKLAAAHSAALQARFATAKAAQAAKLAQVRAVYDRNRAALITRQDLEKAQIRDGWKRIYAEREKAAQMQQHTDRSRERVAQRTGQNFRQARRLDRGIPPAPIDSQAQAPGQPKPRVSVRADFRPSASPQQESKPVKPDFERSTQLPVATQSPAPAAAPDRRVSVPTPAPAPSPAGVPAPSPRSVQSVPQVDRAQDFARSRHGAEVVQKQTEKAAPDALRRGFEAPAAASTTAQPAAPARDFWRANRDEITTPKADASPDHGQTRKRGPQR